MTADGGLPAGVEEWLSLVEQTLRGGDLAELSSTTRDGIEIRPLYTAGPHRPAALTGVDRQRCEQGWDVRQNHAAAPAAGAAAGDGLKTQIDNNPAGGAVEAHTDAMAHDLSGVAVSELRQRIEQDLAGGVTSLELDVPAGVDADWLDAVLEGVDIATTPVALAPHADLGAAEALVALAVRRGATLAPGSSLGLDPLRQWARSGSPSTDAVAPLAGWTAWITAARHAGRAGQSGVAAASESGFSAGQGGVVSASGSGLSAGRGGVVSASGSGLSAGQGGVVSASGSGLSAGIRALTVDSVRYSAAGATEAQALGWATATGVACLRALVEAGIDVDEAAGLIGFRVAATADQFMTIAVLRAARIMWARVVTAAGGSAEAARQYQHAVTAAHTYSHDDPWVNLLRGATAALAAGVAGADAVTVLPFDTTTEPVDADGALGRRLARNTQLLLLEESHLSRAADPAGGSFYVESLTEQLAAQGWRALQQVESIGGIWADVPENRAGHASAGDRLLDPTDPEFDWVALRDGLIDSDSANT